jgi:transcriptional regulator with XRE-family HTH domain
MVQIGASQTPSSNITLKMACYGAATALCAVTVMANLNFGLSLGSTAEERIVYAIASVAADIVKITAVIVVIRLWQKPHRMLACVGAILGLICLAWSLASAAGFALSTREHTAAVHAAASKVIDGWTATIRRAGEQLALVERARAPSVVEAELAAQLVPTAIWKRTRECVELTLPESHNACARVLALRQELAAAQSAQALETRIDEARRELATQPVVGQSADPQVTGLAAMLGTEQATLRRGLALLLAVLVEVGSAFGFALAHAATANPPPPSRSHPPHRTNSPSRIVKAPKAATRNPAPAAVVSFAEQAARLKRGRRPTRPVTGTLGRGMRATGPSRMRGRAQRLRGLLPVGRPRRRRGRDRDQVRALLDRQGHGHGRLQGQAPRRDRVPRHSHHRRTPHAASENGSMTKVMGGIVMGNQIKAARSLLGWTQHELADAAGLHSNAVAYWEQTVAIPTGRHQPHACRQIAEALRRSGVEFVGHAKPGVRLVQNHNYCGRPPSRARAQHGVIPVISGQGAWPPNTQRHDPRLTATRMACGARTRANGSCRAKAMANHRCRMHGGLSSGPKTSAGRARIAEAQRRRWARWRNRAGTNQTNRGIE